MRLSRSFIIIVITPQLIVLVIDDLLLVLIILFIIVGWVTVGRVVVVTSLQELPTQFPKCWQHSNTDRGSPAPVQSRFQLKCSAVQNRTQIQIEGGGEYIAVDKEL